MIEKEYQYYAYVNWKRFTVIEVGKTHTELVDRYTERYGDAQCEHMIDARISEDTYNQFLKEGWQCMLPSYFANGTIHYFNEG